MKQKIKLNIGNRIYPLNVNIEQEEVLRKAAKEINDMITKYEKSYAVKDKQDSLAMCALEIFTNNKKITMDQSKIGSNTEEKLNKLIELIDQNIN
ncbi:MAG: cell division protein ZapA [Flavobacteriaceae bacterium]|tara:strand:+ start:296 stop:580 length:285 start_codon:yes stop_codon:yes gene_type:complete